MWSIDDLKIISDIILPIQYQLLKKDNNKETDDVTTSLYELYKAGISYHDKKKKKTTNKKHKE